jgi:hypothetical protein
MLRARYLTVTRRLHLHGPQSETDLLTQIFHGLMRRSVQSQSPHGSGVIHHVF